MSENEPQGTASSNEPEFSILRIYLKDVSFETPNSPAIFIEEWKPEIKIELDTDVKTIEENIYEVQLDITVTATIGDKTGFLIEVTQAGLFSMKGFDDAHLESMLGAYCPHQLYPYVREAISDMVTKGGFPPLLLTPLNFQEIHKGKLQQQASAG